MNPLTRTLLAVSLLLPGLAAQDFGQQARLDVQVSFRPAAARPGDKVTLVIEAEVEPGYHVYGNKMAFGVPELSIEAGVVAPAG